MSQAGHLSVASNPNVATSFETDSGTAVPVGNVLIINTRDIQDNNDNGIQSTGGLADAGATNRVRIELTNRVQGGLSTIGAGTSDLTLISFDAAPFSGTAGVYVFDFRAAGFETTGPSGGIYHLSGGIRTDGTTPTVIGDFDKIIHEDAALAAADVDIVASANDIVARFTGIAGLTIRWDIAGLYTRSI